MPRALAEAALYTSWLPLLLRAGRGDGHPVLVLPGFLGDDRSTMTARYHLRVLGHATHGWSLGRNLGPTRTAVEGLERLVDELADRAGRRVSIVGWSLGGVYAREIARRRPEVVRTVVTFGSPFRLPDAALTRAARLYRRYEPSHLPAFRSPGYAPPDEPLPVPSTAIYSRSDGIVAWGACIQPVSDNSENIEVYGSHCGLAHNPAVVYATSDRLAQPEGGWRPFQPPWAVRAAYPRPSAP